jgi:hypothetical protein
MIKQAMKLKTPMVNLAITENVKDIDVDGENDENNESEEV